MQINDKYAKSIPGESRQVFMSMIVSKSEASS